MLDHGTTGSHPSPGPKVPIPLGCPLGSDVSLPRRQRGRTRGPRNSQIHANLRTINAKIDSEKVNGKSMKIAENVPWIDAPRFLDFCREYNVKIVFQKWQIHSIKNIKKTMLNSMGGNLYKKSLKKHDNSTPKIGRKSMKLVM